MRKLMVRMIWVGIVVVVGFLVVRAFQPVPVIVDTAAVRRGLLRVTVDDDGRTRVRERYTVSAPIQGRLLRTPLRSGDPVVMGKTVVAEFVAVAPQMLDARTRLEAQARILRAQAALDSTRAQRDQADAEAKFAKKDLERTRELARSGSAAAHELDLAERMERTAQEALNAAEFAVQVARFELVLGRAALRDPTVGDLESDPDVAPRSDEEGVPPLLRTPDVGDGRLELLSPIDGHVLRVFEASARTLQTGMPIVELGNTQAIEIVADYLSQDAVRIREGMPVIISGWGGEDPDGKEVNLRGRVRVVEPAGFTRTSALGVEEQRVNVIVDFEGPPDQREGLGSGYRVELAVVLWEQPEVTIIPTGALFRHGDEHAVFVVAEGRAVRRIVRIGRRGGLDAQIIEGVAPGERVIVYPSELLSEGDPVEIR